MRKVMLDERERVEGLSTKITSLCLLKKGALKMPSSPIMTRGRLARGFSLYPTTLTTVPASSRTGIVRQPCSTTRPFLMAPQRSSSVRSDTGSCERGAWAGIRGQRFSAEAGQLFECVGLIHMRSPIYRTY